MKSTTKVIIGSVTLLSAVIAIELFMGRLILGTDGTFGLISLNTNSAENSQRVFDLYSLSHVTHGLFFYGLLFFVARKVPVPYRFLIAIGFGACWEIFENTPMIINLYRGATVSISYVGDSIVNSISDIFFVMVGFVVAARLPVWTSVSLMVFLELLMLLLIRDDILLNILMFIHSFPAIKAWQSAGGLLS